MRQHPTVGWFDRTKKLRNRTAADFRVYMQRIEK